MYALFSVLQVGDTFTLGRIFRTLKAKETPCITGKTRPIYALFGVTSGVENRERQNKYYSHNLNIGNHRSALRIGSEGIFLFANKFTP